MSIVISGYLVVDTRKLTEHEGHPLMADSGGGRWSLYCTRPGCDHVVLESEPERRTTLPCGCLSQSEHDEGAAIQARMRREFKVPRLVCVGCYVGDDSPTIHTCAIHH